MTTDTKDPDAREVEALANKLVAAYGRGGHLEAARMVLSREAALVAALEDIEDEVASVASNRRTGSEILALAKAREAIRSHRAAKQPSEPTLADAVEAYIARAKEWSEGLQALRAALARERGAK